jgi:prepilin-type N-terminal cleavage/methylation domain-containing protein
MQTKSSRKSGFTLVEIMIVVAIIGLLAAIAIPNFVRARQTSQANACINNLRLIDGAKQQWALENKKASTDVPADTDLQVYLGRGNNGQLPACPAQSLTGQTGFAASYTIGDVQTPPLCQISPNGTPPHVLP